MGESVPEPFDVRTEEALDASLSISNSEKLSPNTSRSSGPRTSSPMLQRKPKTQPFNPFCNIDQLQLSIHCHVNAVKGLVCVPGMAANDSESGFLIVASDNELQCTHLPFLHIYSCV